MNEDNYFPKDRTALVFGSWSPASDPAVGSKSPSQEVPGDGVVSIPGMGPSPSPAGGLLSMWMGSWEPDRSAAKPFLPESGRDSALSPDPLEPSANRFVNSYESSADPEKPFTYPIPNGAQPQYGQPGNSQAFIRSYEASLGEPGFGAGQDASGAAAAQTANSGLTGNQQQDNAQGYFQRFVDNRADSGTGFDAGANTTDLQDAITSGPERADIASGSVVMAEGPDAWDGGDWQGGMGGQANQPAVSTAPEAPGGGGFPNDFISGSDQGQADAGAGETQGDGEQAYPLWGRQGGLDHSAGAGNDEKEEQERKEIAIPNGATLVTSHADYGITLGDHSALFVRGNYNLLYDPGGDFFLDGGRPGSAIFEVTENEYRYFIKDLAERTRGGRVDEDDIPLTPNELKRVVSAIRSIGGAYPGGCAEAISSALQSVLNIGRSRLPGNLQQDVKDAVRIKDAQREGSNPSDDEDLYPNVLN